MKILGESKLGYIVDMSTDEALALNNLTALVTDGLPKMLQAYNGHHWPALDCSSSQLASQLRLACQVIALAQGAHEITRLLDGVHRLIEPPERVEDEA